MSELVTPAQLTSFLRRGALDPDAADLACTVATGWLHDATSLTVWPDPVPTQLFGWALELAGIAYDNPVARDRVTLGRMTVSWGSQAQARRAEILDAARLAYPSTAVDPGGPQGDFPCPEPYPDPAVVWPGPRWSGRA